MSLKDKAHAVNVAAVQPVKKHWMRSIVLFILLTIVVLVVWLAFTSVIHRAA